MVRNVLGNNIVSDPLHEKVSVVVSASGAFDHLCLVLHALARQSVAPTEVLIADDGSSVTDMKAAIAPMSSALPFRLVHVWQPDEGFRLARSRNNAIHRAQGDIIAFLDQDTLPHHTWLELYLAHIMPRRLCLGSVLNLPPDALSRLDHQALESGDFEQWHSASEFQHLNALQRKYVVYTLLRRLKLAVRGRPGARFGNALY